MSKHGQDDDEGKRYVSPTQYILLKHLAEKYITLGCPLLLLESSPRVRSSTQLQLLSSCPLCCSEQSLNITRHFIYSNNFDKHSATQDLSSSSPTLAQWLPAST